MRSRRLECTPFPYAWVALQLYGVSILRIFGGRDSDLPWSQRRHRQFSGSRRAGGAGECTERVAASTAPHRTVTKALCGGWWTWFQSTHQLPPPYTWALLCLIYTCRPFPAGGQRKAPATAGLSYQHTPRCHLRASAISTHPTTREKCEMNVS